MNLDDTFDSSIYAEQVHVAERELASFIGAVKEVFGPEQAVLSAEDWLEEAELPDSPPKSDIRNWRAVTVAASARLASRVTATSKFSATAAPAERKLEAIPSSNCSVSTLLM